MSENIGSTNGGGAKGGNGGGNPEVVTCTVEQPRSGTQVIVGQPFQVSGSSSSDQSKIASVAVFVDRTTLVKAVNDSGDWGSWHASIVVSTAVAHAIHAEATSAKNHIGRSADMYVAAIVDTPALSLVIPAASSPGVITPSDLSFTLAIHAKTIATAVSRVQYQLSGGAWTDLGTFAPANDVTVQGQINLPGGPVPQHGESYPLKVQSTPPGNELDFTISIVDVTRPVVTFVPADGAQVPSGGPVVVTVQASDPGPIASGIASVSVQLDSQPAAFATQPPGGDASTWSATLPPFTHDKPQIMVVVNDVAGNSTPVQHSLVVGLTSWTRLEPVPRDPTLMEGLQARVADPLWLLARQAAFGEFTGQDAASPVSVRLRARSSSLTRMRPARATGPGTLLPHDGGPLEVLTEAEPEPGLHTAPRPLFAAQAGLHYFRLLGRDTGIGDWTGYRNGLLSTYPIGALVTVPVPGVPPSVTTDDPLLQPYIGRVPDGERLYADLASTVRAGGGLPTSPPLAGANAAAVVAAAQAWLSWYDAVTGQTLGNRDTWDPGRLEYAFSIASPGPDAETVLAAAEYDTGSLDWFDFDLLASSLEPAAPGVSLGAVAGDLPPQAGPPPPPPPPPLARGESQIKFVGLPSPVAFRGMPNRRWWDFEDAAIDFGSLTAPVEDITTSLVVEFAMRYGNDHFMIPVPLEVGSVCRVDSLVVTDTYGEVLRIKPVSSLAGPFRLFEHSLATGSSRDPLFVLFPTLGETITGSPIEEVHFVRDEAAEIVWAIEQTVLGPAGIPVDRTQDALAHFHTPPPTPNDGSTLPVRKYVLRTDVEQNWFPFLLPDAAGTELMMAIVPPLDPSGTVPAPLPWGRILAPYAPISGQPGTTLPQEEVTRAGVQVARAWKYARWIDGRQLSWVGRRVRPGRGPGASGVSYDLAL
jgi:Bacterial Ig domain